MSKCSPTPGSALSRLPFFSLKWQRKPLWDLVDVPSPQPFPFKVFKQRPLWTDHSEPGFLSFLHHPTWYWTDLFWHLNCASHKCQGCSLKNEITAQEGNWGKGLYKVRQSLLQQNPFSSSTTVLTFPKYTGTSSYVIRVGRLIQGYPEIIVGFTLLLAFEQVERKRRV